MYKYSNFAPIIVRMAMSLVFIWFGYSQLTNPSMWTSYVPDFAVNLFGGKAVLVVLLNGWFELVAGFTLIFGIQVRIASFLLGAHLFLISLSLGFSALAVRDFGLAIATLSIIFAGPDLLTFDRKWFETII